jgi:hypothetical protein
VGAEGAGDLGDSATYTARNAEHSDVLARGQLCDFDGAEPAGAPSRLPTVSASSLLDSTATAA